MQSQVRTTPPAGNAYPFMRACGWTTVGLALFLLATIHMPLDRTLIRASLVAWVGANSATCFLLCGAALLLARRGGRCDGAVAGAGLAVAAVALVYWTQPLHGWYAASLAGQHLANAPQGEAAAHLWPGRMRDGGATAFLLAGTALAALPFVRGKWRNAVPAGGLAIVLLSFPSLLAAMIGNALTASPGAPGGMLMSLPAACGMIAVGLGLLASADADMWPRQLVAREDRQIFFTSLLLFSLLSLVISVAGIGIVGRHAMREVQEAWRDSFQANRQLFVTSLASAERRSRDIGRFSGLHGSLHGDPDLPALQRAVERVARLAGLEDTDVLTIVDGTGNVLAESGPPRFRGQYTVALPGTSARHLYWDGGWRLSSTVPLAGGASAQVDIALAEFNQRYLQVEAAGATREIRICGTDGAWIRCFPSRLRPEPTRFPLAPPGAPEATRLALGGTEGAGLATDYRGREVLAAYGRIGTTGLALVQKIDADEFYQSLRRKLWLAVIGVTLLILAGASLLCWRTQPLVRRLVRTRARLDATLDNVPAGVFTFDDAGIIRSVNRAGAAMFGYRADDLVGTPVAALLPDLDAHAGDHGRVHQVAGRRRDGGALTLEVVSNAFLLGGTRRGIAVVHDVAERVRIEQALRQREASLAHAQRLAHVGSWELDLVGGAYTWSDETYRMFGLRPSGPPPDHDGLLGMIHPEDRATKLRAAERARLGQGGYDVVYRVLRPDGAFRIVHAQAEVEFDAAGRALRMRGTVQDITEKTLAGEQLRKREEEYRALVENSPDVVARFDRDLRCVYVNQEIRACPGLQAFLAVGRALDGSAAAAPWLDAVRASLADGGRRTFEAATREADGERLFQVTVVPERHRNDKVATVLATARDITAIRAGEHRLRQLSAHMERVREEERKHIAREVHDELGQALTALRMDVGLLRLADGAASPALLARIAAMKDAVDRTIGIVRQVTTALRPAALDLGLAAALEWLVDDFGRRSGIDCWLRADDPEVDLDDGRATALFRIVQESLTNVLRHAHATTVDVTLETRDGHVQLDVRDDGRGFDYETAPQPGKYGLMGMRERVLIHGGEFDVESGPDGTRVRVRLPLAPLVTT